MFVRVFTCSAEGCGGDSGRHVHLAEAEIDQPDVTVRVEHHVLGLQVSVDDVSAVEVVERADDLLDVPARVGLGQALARGRDEREEVTAAREGGSVAERLGRRAA